MKNLHKDLAFGMVGLMIFGYANRAEAQNGNTAHPIITEHGVTVADEASVMVFDLNGPENTLRWSEDFSGGIPSNWTNSGISNGTANANAVWEYRGPSTTPGISTGSRGGYSGATGVIQSATRANGFIIFDSDWRDNNGVAGAFGSGSAPAPHRSVLETGNINLASHENLMLSFYSYQRYFAGEAKLQFSRDGGNTWTQEFRLNPTLPVNAGTPANARVMLDVTDHLGNTAQGRIRFIYDGTIANGTNWGYYFWMIDDIEIRDLPNSAMVFTPLLDGSQSLGVRSDQSQNRPVYGFAPVQEGRGLEFQTNIYNFGRVPQSNVRLDVEVKDQNNNLVANLVSYPLNGIQRGDTIKYAQLRTPVWVPPHVGTFKAVYRVFTDSLNIQTGTYLRDSLYFRCTDTVMGAHFGVNSNELGTTSTGEADNLQVAQRFELKQKEIIKGVRVWLGASTQANATIQVEIYDTTGFGFLTGFSGAAKANSGNISITAANVSQGYRYVPFTNPVTLAKGGYYVNIKMNSNNNTNPVSLRNDQRLAQTPLSAVFFLPGQGNRWYTGYANSLALNAPHIDLIMSDNCTSTSVPTHTRSLTVCEGRSVVVGTNVYTASGNYTDTIKGTAGCDSVVTTNLTVTPMDSSYQSVTICRGDAHQVGNDYLFRDGRFFTVSKNAQGCASLMVTDVTVTVIDTAIYFANDTIFASATGMNYQWYFCGTGLPFPNATNQWYRPTVNGGYRVEISDGTCTDISRCMWITNVSVDENHWSNHVILYPNPAQDVLHVEMGAVRSGIRCAISDLSGRHLSTQTLEATNSHTLNVGHLAAGAYLLTLTDRQGETKTFQFIVQ